ncbi:metal ABC transporter solute-binding protein, Zn/Mn family [Desulfoferrobacter suflitae]|uniref:metal ABC transporter solute-binding protein, Zn/Mn family n=1 Tax=Desulfoferrobacter suflitae TaxID=2865782 RepID=UPI002164CEE4|nr:zinc ABC transporter substrate-binding protein [Desulfoferrobacter suflitae]MCK8600970.1 zinc ABC transporter substrate-binding protein [Desulfoferrobacter suflitae]
MNMAKCLMGLVLFFVWWMSAFPVCADERLKVTVSIVPQRYFLEKIGGDRLDITVMIPPGSSPHSYEPRPQQMVDLSSSKAYFAIGVPFEEVWLTKFAAMNQQMLVVHTQAGIERLAMQAHTEPGEVDEEHTVVPHAHTSRTGCSGDDPHIWLSPPLVMLQARNILTGLLRVDPDHRAVYDSNYRDFIMQLVKLDQKIRNLMQDVGRQRKFMIFHPAWGYFAEAYGLEQIPVEIEGKEPKAKGLRQLIAFARKSGVKTLFVQPQFSSRTAQTIAAEIGCRIVSADPLASDWQENLLKVAGEIAAEAK